jgi:hypothetical protein
MLMPYGLELLSIAFIKNLCADMRCLLLIHKKATVLSSLSTALYK